MSERQPLRLGVLLSGSGTNLQAIMDACSAGEVNALVAVVISNNGDAFGLERARLAGIPAVHIDTSAHSDRSAYDAAVRDTLLAHETELVIMAGYMKLLGREVLEAFPGAVLNIHPALLPSFPGAHGIEEAFDYGVKVTGVTVHFASETFDEGPIVVQEAVPVLEDDTLEALESRIHEAEYRLYPKAISLFADGRLTMRGRRVHARTEEPIE